LSGAPWRLAALAGVAAGLGAAPLAGLPAGEPARAALAGALVGGVAVGAARRGKQQAPGRPWLVALGLAAALFGLAAGTLRLAAIDAGALRAEPGSSVRIHGFVAEVPRRQNGEVTFVAATRQGRVQVTAPEPVPDLPVGTAFSVAGTARAPDDWQAGYLARHGVARIVETRNVTVRSGARGGLAGVTDAIRLRGEDALGRGTPAPEAALLRGFVLGEDDRIDSQTVTEFQRSGLAHLLAVSGQNVVLLALLAMPILALMGAPLRIRLACVLVLIAVYVPVAGAGPSIQRAGVMGAAGIVAGLSGRPVSRWYALLLAAAATLALNPRSAGDAGWQLSFAAVAGIALWTAPLRDLFSGPRPGRTRAAIAEGAAMTVAATLATAPLMAHDFDAVSVAALPANLIVLPAVAPVMWLGMLAAGLGQLPGVPIEPLTGLAGLFAAYIAQVAHWFSAPGWAQVKVSLPGPVGVLAAYAMLATACGIALAVVRRRRELAHRPGRLGLPAAAILAIGALVLAGGTPSASAEPDPPLEITVMDVGQGDAIALEPRGAGAIVVDGGPQGDDLAEKLHGLGIDELAAAVLTHDQSDHAGGLDEALGAFPIDRVVYAKAGRPFLADSRAAAVPLLRVAEGSEVDSGALRLEVLWPPRELMDSKGVDPNELAIVLLARWHRFAMLLTADAEAEAVPVDPGPIDVLKVAHHGSADAGLPRLLDRTAPRLAVISVGAGNPYGHPDPSTLATLEQHGVPVIRTDLAGDVTIAVDRDGWSVR
jgi:competence protein ComEC